jgi:hypothetical protein
MIIVVVLCHREESEGSDDDDDDTRDMEGKMHTADGMEVIFPHHFISSSLYHNFTRLKQILSLPFAD